MYGDTAVLSGLTGLGTDRVIVTGGWGAFCIFKGAKNVELATATAKHLVGGTPFGLHNLRDGKELRFDAVFRLDPDGTLSPVAGDCVMPNGLCFSPDERTLYVADTPALNVRAYDVRPDGTLAK